MNAIKSIKGLPQKAQKAQKAQMKKRKYKFLIQWSKDDGSYIAEVPELPGCMADGDTYEPALKNVEIVIREWVETALELNRQIPEPKGRLLFA